MLPLRMLGLLLLMSLLCDADSTCPTKFNPLTLDPPEIIGEYETEVSVNCTTTNEDYDVMYWRDRNESMEQDNNFISMTLLMSDWNAEAQCKIKLNETSECSKDLKITVYKDPDNIILFPVNYVKAALEKTQYDLQCDIINVAPVQNLTVRWYKDNNIILTLRDSFTNTTKKPVSESSVLTVNISRGDDGAQFRCEAQLDFGPHGPQCPSISSDIHRVSVHYAPEFKNKTDIVDVYVGEGDNVTLNCEAEGNPPPIFHWTNDRVNISENTNNLYINRVNTGATYSCTAANHLGSITKQIHVHVVKTTMAKTTPEPSAAIDCPLTLTPAEIVVRFGDPASVNCSTSATNVLGMGWEATLGGVGFAKRVAVTWMVDKLEDWVMEPKCYITLQNNQQCDVSPVITLYKTPDNVLISDSDYGPMVEGTERQLTCDIINVAPVRNLMVKWYRGNETVHTQMFNGSSATPVNVSSTLRVTPERDYNGAHFRCEAELHLRPKGPELVPTTSSAPYIAVVHYKPLIQSCPRSYAGVEHKFSMEMVPCQVDGNPPPSVVWFKQNKEIPRSEKLKRTDSGEYTVKVENVLGEINAFVDITVEYSPSFTCNDRYEVEENAKSQTTCKPEGIPTPTITWVKDGKNVTSQPWKKNDNGTYLLIATNKHGTTRHRLYLDVLYAPVFKEGDYNKEVALGENVTFDCSAEGNPPPEIDWKYRAAANVEETTRERQKNINITGATSTNAGVYSCTATNKVGSVTRSVTLRMKDTTSRFPLWLLIPIGIIIITAILIIYLKCRKQHGQYNFVPNKTNGSDIPMSTKSAEKQV